MVEPINEEAVRLENENMKKTYKVLDLIDRMLAPLESRPNIHQVQAEVNFHISPYEHDETLQMIDNMRSKSNSASNRKAIGWGYLRLGKIDEWKKISFS